jgi:hypothetical protein
MRFLNIHITAVMLATLLIGGCTNSPNFRVWDKTLLSPTYWHKMTSEQQTKESRRQIKQALLLSDYLQAQKHMVAAHRADVAEAQLKQFYPQIINPLLLSAEQAKERNFPTRAGRLFMLAKEVYPTTKQFNSTINLTEDAIDKQIEHCADELMRAGLNAYRSGALSIAVESWTEIDQFAPDHTPSQLAINTAKQQLQSLEKLTSKKE